MAANAAGLSAQVQQRKSVLSRKHVLKRMRFVWRYENYYWWLKLCDFQWQDKVKINRFNSDGRSRCWIGDNEQVGPQHVHSWSMLVGQWRFEDAWQLLGRKYDTKLKVRWIHIYTNLFKKISCGPLHKITIQILSRLVFQHDNDPNYMSKSMQGWLVSQPMWINCSWLSDENKCVQSVLQMC